MANQRISTGIDGLDPLIGGGLVPNRSFLVSGEPGTGKTIFCLQYILEGAKKGEKGIYVSIDEKPEHLIFDAACLGWDIQGEIDKGMVQILDVSSYFAQARFGKDVKIEVERIAEELSRHIKKMNAKRLVIDPIAPLVSKAESVSDIQAYIKSLISLLEESSGCTMLITSHVPVGSNKLSQYDMEEFVVSGIFLLRLVKPEKKYVRSIFVRKMRATAIDLSEWAFDIAKGKGLVLRQPL
jgi:circadian clock protein KaiC